MDYGTKRVGIAVSDDDMLIAFPLTTLDRRKKFIENLKNIVHDYQVETIVVGHPLDIEGEEGEMAKKVRKEARRIADSLGVEYVLWDERFTTRQVDTINEQAAKLKDKKDAVAATLILQSYLDYLWSLAEPGNGEARDLNHDSA